MTLTARPARPTTSRTPARAAEIVREYGPFAGADESTASRHDGRRVWAATGAEAARHRSGERRGRAHARARRRCRHRVRRHPPLPDRRGAHRQDRSGHRRRAGVDSRARRGPRLGPGLGRGQPLGRPVPRPQDPPDRPRDRRDPAHHRVEPLRHRRDLGRRRAVARHLGRRRERHPPHRPATAAPCSSGSRCRPAPASAGWSRTAPSSSIAAAARAARSAPCAGRSAAERARASEPAVASPIQRAPHHRSTAHRARSNHHDHRHRPTHRRTMPSCPQDRWIAERKTLMAHEKELTHLRDQIARERRALPWVRIDKDYVFDRPQGRGRSPSCSTGAASCWSSTSCSARAGTQGCPSCSFMADHIDGMNVHLEHRDVTLRRGLARTARRDRALPPAHGLAVPVGVVERERLQLRLPRQLHAEERATATSTTTTTACRSRSRGGAGHQRVLPRTTRARSSTPTRPTAAASR